MGITDPNLDAHHLIPAALSEHPLVQRGAEAGWHMNHSYNGMALPSPHAYAGHPNYNNYVDELLTDAYEPNINSEDAYEALMTIADKMRALIDYYKPPILR